MPIGTLVSDAPVATTPTYCTVADVYRVLQKPLPHPSTSDEGEPSQADVKGFILEVEAEVDRTCRRSWRARRISLEYQGWDTWVTEGGWLILSLERRPVLALSSAQGDGFEVWNGGAWEDWLTTKTEGRNADWWLEEPAGRLWMRRHLVWWDPRARVKLSYRYGASSVPHDIRLATARLVAAELASGDLVAIGGNGGNMDRLGMDPKVRRWQRLAYAALAQYQQVGGGA